MLYHKLNPEMQRLVDAYATRLASLPWSQRRELLAEATPLFAEDLEPEQAQLAARGFLTAILERWAYPEVNDPDQAALYLSSLSEGDRALAELYLTGGAAARGDDAEPDA